MYISFKIIFTKKLCPSREINTNPQTLCSGYMQTNTNAYHS